MRLGGGLGGDSRLPKEPRKKILAEAAARGVAAPPAADDRPIRYSMQRFGGVRQLANRCHCRYHLQEPRSCRCRCCVSGASWLCLLRCWAPVSCTCGSTGSRRAVGGGMRLHYRHSMGSMHARKTGQLA
jgi:hypothetical protein